MTGLVPPGGDSGDGGAGGTSGQALPELPGPDLPAPSAPAAPPPEALVLPPVNAPGPNGAHAAAGKSQMTLMSPTGLNEGDETDWAVVVGVALVAEIGLLWGAACVGLWRRRIAFERAAEDGVAAGTDGRVFG